MPSLRQQHMGAYNVWKAARQRCNNPNDKRFPQYGGRGIEFRFNSFDHFILHIGPRPEGMTLERIDNDGHYEEGNVRWATHSEQACNRSNTRKYTYQGKTMSCLGWANELGVPFWTMHSWLKRADYNFAAAIRFRTQRFQ